MAGIELPHSWVTLARSVTAVIVGGTAGAAIGFMSHAMQGRPLRNCVLEGGPAGVVAYLINVNANSFGGIACSAVTSLLMSAVIDEQFFHAHDIDVLETELACLASCYSITPTIRNFFRPALGS